MKIYVLGVMEWWRSLLSMVVGDILKRCWVEDDDFLEGGGCGEGGDLDDDWEDLVEELLRKLVVDFNEGGE